MSIGTVAEQQARTCGECGLCCKLLAVEALGKPAHTWCDHFAAKTGCAIYERRPDACRAFRCLWLDQTALGAEWKPNRSHIVLHLAAGENQLIATVDPEHPEAWKRKEYHALLRDWAERGLADGFQVIVKVGPRIVAIMPDRDIDLGEFAEDERVRFARVRTPEGIGLVARRVPAE